MARINFQYQLALPKYMAFGVVTLSWYTADWNFLYGLIAVYLGWICTAPNANLADGCLAQLALAVGYALGFLLTPYFFYLGLVCWITWLFGSAEYGINNMEDDEQNR